MSKYFLLTGASGLLGSYLLRDALLAGHSIAVLVRPSRMESARQRVESILARWEEQLGCVLPRPVVLEGDICRESLGLDDAQAAWVAQHCHSLIHSAASLSFELDEKTNEPWRSNLEGTRNVLAFARRAGIRKFHHVSTSYICGLRTGRVLESEVDVGQALANPYEESKLQSEKLVRAADYFDQVTIYRPAIIVGDSHTGYTSTFHGFYTPLKVVHLMVGKVEPTEMNVGALLLALGLTGQERKNFVPVDWVSAMMVHILGRPQLHGNTYHLTPGERVSITDMAAAIESAVIQFSYANLSKVSDSAMGGDAFEALFQEQMRMYRSYWRDDPEFDQSNVTTAAPHLPCPKVSVEMMLNLSRYAIESSFGWPVPQPVPPQRDIAELLGQNVTRPEWLVPSISHTHQGNGHAKRDFWMGLEVSGPGGGQWSVLVRDGNVSLVRQGITPDARATLYLTSSAFCAIADGHASAAECLRRGRLVVESEDLPLDTALASLEHAARGSRHAGRDPAPSPSLEVHA